MDIFIGLFVCLIFIWVAVHLIRLPSDDALYRSLHGASVVVTGASRGVGEELAYAASRGKAALLITARSKDLLEKVASKCRHLGAREVTVVAADMAAEEDVGRLVRTVLATFERLDHLVLNHALQIPVQEWRGAAEDVEMLKKMMAVNVWSCVELSSRLLPLLETSKGRIVAVSTFLTKLSVPFLTSYQTTKFALQGFFEGLQHDLIMSGSAASVTIAVFGKINTATQERITSGGNFVRQSTVSGLPGFDAGPTAMATLKASLARKKEVLIPWNQCFLLSFLNFPFGRDIVNAFLHFAMRR